MFVDGVVDKCGQQIFPLGIGVVNWFSIDGAGNWRFFSVFLWSVEIEPDRASGERVRLDCGVGIFRNLKIDRFGYGRRGRFCGACVVIFGIWRLTAYAYIMRGKITELEEFLDNSDDFSTAIVDDEIVAVG